uniref:Uncharacterized protein n=1 Tax=Salarias fasciatus TaxID=181472 RepID=A0A672JC14_SALFA
MGRTERQSTFEQDENKQQNVSVALKQTAGVCRGRLQSDYIHTGLHCPLLVRDSNPLQTVKVKFYSYNINTNTSICSFLKS